MKKQFLIPNSKFRIHLVGLLLTLVMMVSLLGMFSLTAFAADGTTNTVTDFSVTDFHESVGLYDGWINEVNTEGVSGGDIEDSGKTAWEDSDEIFVTLTSQKYGTQTVALIFDAHSWSWAADGYFRYAEGETPDISAIYAPCYERTADGMQLRNGMQLGMTEYIEADCQIVDGAINISFDNATRNYSRLRIVGLPEQTYTVTTTDFTPAGSTLVADPEFTLTTDDKGNAYLYGTFAEGARILVKQGNAELANYAFTADKDFSNGTEPNKSYALDARPFIDGTLGLGYMDTATEDDVNALVEKLKKYVDNGITTIIVAGDSPAMYDSVMGTIPAYAEALYLLADGNNQSPYCGTIDLILPDATEIVDHAFDNAFALKSITLPKVTTVGDGAFYGCTYLRTMTFGSVVTTIIQNERVVFYYVGEEVGGCDLVLNCGQMNSTYIPDLTANTWYDDNNKYFKSITLTHTGKCDECNAAQ